MKVHRDINNLPVFRNAVVTIGTFDGVHTGHLQIINQLKKEAKEIRGESVIITFHPHPRHVILSKKTEIKLLNTLDEKMRLLEKQDIDHLVIVSFTPAFSEQTAENYIENFLAGKFHPHTFIIGYDHRFGKGREGDYELLEQYAPKFHYTVKEIPEHVLNQVAVSSTKIREALYASDIVIANYYLGYEYFFEGSVTEGDKIGRTIGYPTANVRVNDADKLIPANGVYAVEVLLGANGDFTGDNERQPLYGMMNIGYRPTLNATKKTIEVNIFDFDENIYNLILRISVKKYLRAEQKFNGLEELKKQLAKDKTAAAMALGL